VEVYQIRVFLEVARQLSFTEAADTLNLTQPAVSAKIKSLEAEIGTSLFYRLGRKIQLTEAGQFLLEEGPSLIDAENHLLQKIEEIKQGRFGQLKIGYTPSVADGWLPEVVFQFRQTHPTIQTQCVAFAAAESLYRALIANEIDVGIADINVEPFAELSATAIADIHYSLIVSPTHPLAKQNWLSLKTLKHEKWVLPPVGSPSRLVFESRLAELGLSLDFSQVETVDTLNLMRTYLLQGYLGFASHLELKTELHAGTLAAVSLQEFALPAQVFLLLPKRLESAVFSAAGSKRSPTSPLRSFVTLLQGSQRHLSTSASPKMRSPSFLQRAAPSRSPDEITLTIGTQNTTIPLITGGLVIQRLGLLEHFLPRDGRYSGVQYNIRWQDFALGAPIIAGLQSGQLDIGLLGDYPLLLSAIHPEPSAARTRLVSFVATNPDGSCNAVIVPGTSALRDLDDLWGRMIAVPWNSSAHGMVMRSLDSANLLPHVTITALDQSTLVRPFTYSDSHADGYAHFAPFHTIACRNGTFRYLLNDDLSGLPTFHGVVVRESLADHYPEIIIAYLKALQAAQYWCANTPSALALISRWIRIDREIIGSILHTPLQQNQPGQFFSDMTLRRDWVEQHIAQLAGIPGNEHLKAIDLNHWMQPEFLQYVQRN
jgi:NitT/TauT family transport system substrate-binding protein